MKGLIILVLIVVVLVAVYVAATTLYRQLKDRNAKWKVLDFETRRGTSIYLVKGRVEEHLGTVYFKDIDYNDQKMALIDEANTKALERNSTDKYLETVNS